MQGEEAEETGEEVMKVIERALNALPTARHRCRDGWLSAIVVVL
jgi:hypothetical protein